MKSRFENPEVFGENFWNVLGNWRKHDNYFKLSCFYSYERAEPQFVTIFVFHCVCFTFSKFQKQIASLLVFITPLYRYWNYFIFPRTSALHFLLLQRLFDISFFLHNNGKRYKDVFWHSHCEIAILHAYWNICKVVAGNCIFTVQTVFYSAKLHNFCSYLVQFFWKQKSV